MGAAVACSGCVLWTVDPLSSRAPSSSARQDGILALGATSVSSRHGPWTQALSSNPRQDMHDWEQEHGGDEHKILGAMDGMWGTGRGQKHLEKALHDVANPDEAGQADEEHKVLDAMDNLWGAGRGQKHLEKALRDQANAAAKERTSAEAASPRPGEATGTPVGLSTTPPPTLAQPSPVRTPPTSPGTTRPGSSPPATTPPLSTTPAPYSCSGLRELSVASQGTLTAGAPPPAGDGRDCRWLVNVPGGGEVQLTMDFSVHGSDSRILLYEGQEARQFLREDVLPNDRWAEAGARVTGG